MSHIHHIEPKGNRIINILILIALIIIVSSPTMLAGAIIYSAVNSKDLWIFIIMVIIGIIWTIFIMWLFRWVYQKRSYEKMNQPFKLKDILINILWFIIIRIIVSIFTIIMQNTYNDSISKNDKILMKQIEQLQHLSISSVISLLFFLIMIIFIAPYLEELLFRGIFKEMLFKKSTFLLPLIISSIIFGALHASTNWISFLMYVTIGFCLYMAYNRRKNVKDSMMVHVLNNAVAGVSMITMLFT